MTNVSEIAHAAGTRKPIALAVEDDTFERLRLIAVLERLGYEVRAVSDGAEALSELAAGATDIIVSDWHLPVMSGLELCRAMRATDPLKRPFTMLVTARDNLEDVVAALDAGADDFLAKPYRAEELGARLKAGQRMMKLRRELAERTSLLENALRHQGRMRQIHEIDLSAAIRLQQQLLEHSTQPVPGVNFAHFFRPTLHIGGDVFGVLARNDAGISFFHIDATGHGLAGALHAFATATAFHGMASDPATCDDPVAWLEELNRRAVATGTEASCSLIAGCLDTRTGTGRMCIAGMPHPLIIDNSGGIRALESGGLPIGGMAETRYSSIEFTLGDKERLVLLSDGVTDCNNPAGEAFGTQRLEQALSKHAQSPLEEMVRKTGRELDDWRDTAHHGDDVSLLALELQAARA